MVDALADTGVDREALQRRTLRSLRFAQVPGQAAVAGMVAVVSLLASDLLGSDRLAGMGSASFTIGAAFTAIPLAAFMRRRGRRVGLVRALLIGAVGASIAATGGQLRWFPLFVIGMLAFGAGQAATLQQRYVAADLAEPEQQGASIAAIVWVGTLGAALGPLLTPFEKAVAEQLGLDELVGPFLFAAAFFLVAATVVWARLRPDPLEVIGGIDPHAERVRLLRVVRSSASVIWASSGARLGIAALAASQAAMVGVMTMTPPHMKDHGHADLSALVIALHIVGMYGLSPWVGRFVDRRGAVRGIQVGAFILGAGTVATVMAGYVPALMFVGLFVPRTRLEFRTHRRHDDPHCVGAGGVSRRGAGDRGPDAQPVWRRRGAQFGVREGVVRLPPARRRCGGARRRTARARVVHRSDHADRSSRHLTRLR